METVTATRRTALLTAVAAITAGLQLAAAPPAAAQLGLEVRTASSAFDAASPKGALALCPPGKAVIGGGGLATVARGRFFGRFTQLIPLDTSGQSSFLALAEMPFNQRNPNWLVNAYAICMNRSAFRDYTIIGGGPPPSSKTFQTAMTPSCPPGTVAYSAGGAIVDPPV